MAEGGDGTIGTKRGGLEPRQSALGAAGKLLGQEQQDKNAGNKPKRGATSEMSKKYQTLQYIFTCFSVGSVVFRSPPDQDT